MDDDTILSLLKDSLNIVHSDTSRDDYLKFLVQSAQASVKLEIGNDDDFYQVEKASYLPIYQELVLQKAHDSFLNRASSTDVDLFGNAAHNGKIVELRAAYAKFEADKAIGDDNATA